MMQLDGLTLMVAGSFAATVCCVLLFGAWSQLRSERAILWWACAFTVDAIAVATLAVGFALDASALIAVGSGGMPLAATAIVCGIRSFNRRSIPWLLFPTVVVLWLVAGFAPLPGPPHVAAMSVTLAMASVLFFLAGAEAARAEPLAARWPMVAVIWLHAFMFATGVVDIALGNVPPDQVPPLNSWFSLIHFEQIVFLLGSAVFIVMMARQRVEKGYIAAARIDALTGVANRGAFLVQADRLLRRARAQAVPCSLIAFDLDHFKQINDTHGHAAGDVVLREFARAAVGALRPADLFGRIGGEEFAALLPATGIEAAAVIAERVRHAFEAVAKDGADAIGATVSAGVASDKQEMALETLMASADRALYRAKGAGRNRVERAADAHSNATSNVIRVA